QKLDDGHFAAIILAAAGMKRLGVEKRIQHYFSPEEILPAVGQGVLGVECLKHNQQIIKLVSVIEDLPTRICINAERALNYRLNGGCQLPTAAYAIIAHDQLFLRGLVID